MSLRSTSLRSNHKQSKHKALQLLGLGNHASNASDTLRSNISELTNFSFNDSDDEFGDDFDSKQDAEFSLLDEDQEGTVYMDYHHGNNTGNTTNNDEISRTDTNARKHATLMKAINQITIRSKDSGSDDMSFDPLEMKMIELNNADLDEDDNDNDGEYKNDKMKGIKIPSNTGTFSNLHLPPTLSPETSQKMAGMEKLGSGHKMHRSASFDNGTCNFQLNKMNQNGYSTPSLNGYKNITSDTNITMVSMNENRASSRHHSVQIGIGDLKIKKELVEIKEDVINNIDNDINEPNSGQKNMENLMYLMVKQGLYTAKNLKSVLEIRDFQNDHNKNFNGLF